MSSSQTAFDRPPLPQLGKVRATRNLPDLGFNQSRPVIAASLISSQGQADAGRGASWRDTGTDTQSSPRHPGDPQPAVTGLGTAGDPAGLALGTRLTRCHGLGAAGSHGPAWGRVGGNGDSPGGSAQKHQQNPLTPPFPSVISVCRDASMSQPCLSLPVSQPCLSPQCHSPGQEGWELPPGPCLLQQGRGRPRAPKMHFKQQKGHKSDAICHQGERDVTRGSSREPWGSQDPNPLGFFTTELSQCCLGQRGTSCTRMAPGTAG